MRDQPAVLLTVGLRDYGTGEWEGGEDGCDHVAGMVRGDTQRETPGGRGGSFRGGTRQFADECGKCGGRRVDRQIGLESTPDEFVARLVEVFREVRRVLRSDGTCFVVIGDSYANDAKWGGSSGGKHVTALHGDTGIGRGRRHTGLKGKDLIGVPWLLAFALRADGWSLRSAICWTKPNPMPESVTDRPTSAYEHVFLFAKCRWTGPEPGRFAHISDEDARWLALLLDTEGNIVVKRAALASGRTTYGAQIAVGNTNRALMERARDIAGVGTVGERAGKSAPMFYWQISNQQARDLLHRICPFLIVKGRQARCAIHLQDVIRESNADRRGKVGQLRGRTRTDAYTAVLERLWMTIKALNRFGNPDISWVPEVQYGRWVPQPYFWDADAIRETHSENTHGGNVNGCRSAAHLIADRPFSDRSTLDTKVLNPAGRNKRNVWEIATQPYPDAHFACVDERTECLTTEGWKRHDELCVGDSAAQFDMATETLSWGPVEALARYHVSDQEMVVGKRRDLDLVLTPNHRCVIQRRHPHTRRYQHPVIVRADELLPSHAIPSAAPWDVEGDASLPLEWAELLGWYIAEGHEKRTWGVEIFQSESANPKKVQRIEALLRQVGAEWTAARAPFIRNLANGKTYEGVAVAFKVDGYAAVRLRELAPGKHIPIPSLTWQSDRIEALLRGLLGGDGHLRDDGRWSFIQKDKTDADMVQALALRLGLSASCTARKDDGMWTVYITKHLTRTFRGTGGYGSPLARERYTGVVWCPKLPHGTWLARRNGRCFITGNTFPPKLVEPCILAGSSPKACGECGAPWVRVVERDPGDRSHALVPSRVALNHGDRPNGRPRSAHPPGWRQMKSDQTWTDVQPSCAHNDDTGRSVILDPFAGAGTTGVVALRHDRSFIGIELSPAYAEMARNRIRDDAPLLNTPAEVAQA